MVGLQHVLANDGWFILDKECWKSLVEEGKETFLRASKVVATLDIEEEWKRKLYHQMLMYNSALSMVHIFQVQTLAGKALVFICRKMLSEDELSKVVGGLQKTDYKTEDTLLQALNRETKRVLWER